MVDFGVGLAWGCIGNTSTALMVLALEDVLLSADVFLDCEDLDVDEGRIVLELSSETFPVNIFGGDSLRGDDGVFFGDSGGNGRIRAAATC